MKSVRRIYRVRWYRAPGEWRIVLADGTARPCWSKVTAVLNGAILARRDWKAGSPAQLVVHNKNGRIAFERTYGRDPKRFKG